MGWSSYTGMNAEQAIRHELRGYDIISKSGAWWLVRVNRPADEKWHGHVTLVHALTQRHGGETAIKLIDVSMGPTGTPPKSIFRRWLKESAGQERGGYEEEFIQRVEQEHNAADERAPLKPGDTFRTVQPIRYADGVSEDTFIYFGKFRAHRVSDRVGVRLPRDFRKRIASAATT